MVETVDNIKNISIHFNNCKCEISNEPLNDSFNKGILRVAYTGKNRNNTFISKQTFEDAIPTIYNCPIVANYIRDEDEIGSHDIEIVEKDGNYHSVNITHPVGVVPESAKYWWENIQEEDGSIHEYLCIEILLWKRQECYEKIKKNGTTSESMEITVKEGMMVDGIYHIKKMIYTAFCLLEKAEPCFESASISLFSKQERNQFKQEFAEMLEDLKSFNLNKSKGEEKMDKTEILSKYGLTPEQLQEVFEFDFETIEVQKLEELCEKFKNDERDNKDNKGQEDDDKKKSDYSLTLNTIINQIVDELGNDTAEDEWGYNCPKYWYIDIQDNEVIVYSTFENWTLYGLPFSMDGDNVVIDYTNKKKKKVNYVDFDEGSKSEQYSANPALEYASKLAKFMQEKVNEVNSQLHECEDEIKGFKQEKFLKEVKDVFAKFDNTLSGNDEYQQYKTERIQKLDKSCDEIESHCFAIIGKMKMESQSKFELNTKTVKIGVDNTGRTSNKKSPYGGIFDDEEN